MSDIILETRGLTKHYGGVHALKDANFILRKGEHVAIMGDNGAGKSTFVRQITGVEQRTRGEVLFDGKPVSFSGPLDAREAGIEAVFQNLALADHLASCRPDVGRAHSAFGRGRACAAAHRRAGLEHELGRPGLPVGLGENPPLGQRANAASLPPPQTWRGDGPCLRD